MGIASDLAAALDPVIFAEQTGLGPDAWQAVPKILAELRRLFAEG